MRILGLFIFIVFCASPAYAGELMLSAKDIAALEAKAKAGRTDARDILDRYNKQLADEKEAKEIASASGVIGTVMEVEGVATITPAGGVAANAAVNDVIHLNDVVETGRDGRMFILFIDNTELTLSANTKLAVDEWAYDPENNADNKGIYSILKGTFLYVSGLIAKKENPDVTIHTAVGSIGIRGTQFWGGEIEGEYGILVQDGSVAVRNDAGEVTVEKGLGTFIRDRKSRPAAVQAWKPERLQRAVATVALKRQALVKQRIGQQQQKNKVLGARYKVFREQHRKMENQRRENQKGGQVMPRREQQQKQMQQQKQQQPMQQKPRAATPDKDGQKARKLEQMDQQQEMQRQLKNLQNRSYNRTQPQMRLPGGY